MSSKRVRIIILAGSVLVVLILAVSLILTYTLHQSFEVDLPQTSLAEPTINDNGAESSDESLLRVQVTMDTVQDVIATLNRPIQYTRDIRIECNYTDGSTDYNIYTIVTPEAQSLRVIGTDPAKHIMLVGDTVYIWFDGDKDYYMTSVDAPGDGRRTADELQMLPTYEDIVTLDQSAIMDAGYVIYNEEYCIFVTYFTPLLHYETTCYISVKSGLLTGVEQYDGQMLIYRMNAYNFTTELPDTLAFILPDDTNVLSVP